MNEYHPPLAIGKEELLWKWKQLRDREVCGSEDG